MLASHDHRSKEGTLETSRCSNCGDRLGWHHCETHDQDEYLIFVDGAGSAWALDGQIWFNVDHPEDRRDTPPTLPECTGRLMVSEP